MYGKREVDGMPVSIRDIPVDKYGRRCGCVCPECGKPFEACSLDGEREPYFRHHTENRNGSGGNPDGCTADHANESALHLMAKKIIEQEGKVFAAELAVYLSKLGLELPDYVKKRLPNKHVFCAARVLNCREVELEKAYPGFRVDASVTTDDGTYLIEIRHKHKTDKLKLDKVKECGLPMLEIDISPIVDEYPSFDKMRKFIIRSLESRKWVFFPGESNRIHQAKEEYLRHPVVVKYFEEQEKERQEKEQRDREYRRVKQIVAEAFEPDNYRKTVESLHNNTNQSLLRNDTSTYHFNFYADTQQIPFFVNIPITGEIIFQCHRSIWQGRIFDRWIYYRRPGKNQINQHSLWDSLVEQECIPYDHDLSRTADFSDEPDVKNLRYYVIHKYLEYLKDLGFIQLDWLWATVLQSHSIIPPNQEYATCLQNALMNCDAGSVHVDEQIATELAPYFAAKAAKEEQEREEREAARRREVEAVQKREALKREQERLAADSEMQIKFCEKQELQEADYDQEDYLIYDNYSQRWMRCIVCNRAVKAKIIRQYIALNKGICVSCLLRQS
jgi:hypothetical protein